MGYIEDNDTFVTISENGEEIEFTVLFTFEHDDNNYVVYTDFAKDEDGDTSVYASRYTPGEDTFNLLPIETEEEWELIEFLLKTMADTVQNGGELDADEIMDIINDYFED